MNRYVVEGLLADACAGKQVMVVGDCAVSVHEAFESVTRSAEGDVISRGTCGAERIEAPSGGCIRFITRRSLRQARGRRLDVAYIDCDLDFNELSALIPALPTADALVRR